MSEREQFEQWLKENDAPDDNFMFSELIKGCMYEAWIAAKEKNQARWIPVSERLPDYDQEVIWYYEETGIIKIFSFDKDDYPIREWNFPPSHWMPMAPWSTIEPSTQGGGE